MGNYEILKLIGKGTFGMVYKSKLVKSGEIVAIKKTQIDNEAGLSFTTIREIKVLKKLRNPHILSLKDAFLEENALVIVLEYMPYDLTGLIAMRYEFTEEQIHSLMYQMIKAINFIHSNGFIHRDIKPSNILINNNGILKIADFGLTRTISGNMTNRVCTLWYRAPELLLGDVNYSGKVDCWSIACIVLELKAKRPIFAEEDEILQIKEIFKKLGAPVFNYPWCELFESKKYKKEEPWGRVIEMEFGHLYSHEMLRILEEMLRLDKNKRISSSNLLELPFLQSASNKLFPLHLGETHEFDWKKSP